MSVSQVAKIKGLCHLSPQGMASLNHGGLHQVTSDGKDEGFSKDTEMVISKDDVMMEPGVLAMGVSFGQAVQLSLGQGC